MEDGRILNAVGRQLQTASKAEVLVQVRRFFLFSSENQKRIKLYKPCLTWKVI